MVTLKVFFAGTKMKRSFKQYLHVLSLYLLNGIFRQSRVDT